MISLDPALANDRASMSALQYLGPRSVSLDRVPSPTLHRRGTVLVQVAWCGLCGSDIHEYIHGPVATPWERPHPLTGEQVPVTMGHEFSGTVVAISPDVVGISEGAPVVVEPLLRDGSCTECQRGKYNRCRKVGFVGLSGGGGGLSEYVAVPAGNVHKLPTDFDLALAALIEPLAVALHAVETSNVNHHSTALVFGAGPIGLAITALLHAKQVEKVIAVEPNEHRASLAESLGAHAVSELPADRRGRTELLEDRVDVAFNAAGVQAALDGAISVVRPGGTIVDVGLWANRPSVDMNRIVARELRLLGSFAYCGETFAEVIRLMTAGLLDPAVLVTDHIELAEVPDLLERWAEGEAPRGKVLVRCT